MSMAIAFSTSPRASRCARRATAIRAWCRRSRMLRISSCTSRATTGTSDRSLLGEKINALNPMGEPVLSFFCQSGTEAVEGALKLARYVTGRTRFIGFLGGFHGRTMGSLAFTSSKYTQQKGFFPTMPGVTHVPYPNSIGRCSRATIRARRCSTTSRRCCSHRTCRRAKSRPF